MNAAVTSLREALTANADVPDLQAKVEALSAAMQEVGAAVYGAQQAANAPGGGGGEGAAAGAGAADESTIEGEFREV